MEAEHCAKQMNVPYVRERDREAEHCDPVHGPWDCQPLMARQSKDSASDIRVTAF